MIFIELTAIKYSTKETYTWNCWELAKTIGIRYSSHKDYFHIGSRPGANSKRHCSMVPTKIKFDATMIVKNIQMWWHCFPSYTFCDTHNSLTPVIFAIEITKKVTLFKVGFSSDGVFDVITMFNEINWKWMQENNKDFTVLYAALPHFYDATYDKTIAEDLDENKYQLPLGYKWRKAQTCASCASQEMQITRSVSKTKSKEQALETAWELAISGSASTSVGFQGFGDVGLSLGFDASRTRSRSDTFSDELSLGTDIVKTISCNSKNIYLYGLSITSWNGKTETIPTDFYYCSDKDIEPICIPKIKGNEQSSGTASYCNGGDVEEDFKKDKEGPKDTANAEPAEPAKTPKRKSGIHISDYVIMCFILCYIHKINHSLIIVARAIGFDNMYLNGLHITDIHDGQSVDSRDSKLYSKSIGIDDKRSIAFMITIVSGISIICGCIILIFSISIGCGCAYFKANRKKIVNGFESCNISHV